MSGKRDRPANLQIDEKTLEYKKISQPQPEVDTQQKIKQRTIYKIKPSGSSAPEPVGQSKPKFTLFPSASKQEGKPEKPASSSQQEKPKESDKKPEVPEDNKDNVEKKEEPAKNFLSNFSISTAGFGSTFGNGVGLFPNSASNGQGIFSKNSIFGNKDDKPSLFSFGGPQKASSTVFGSSQSVFNFGNGVPPIKKQISKPNEDEDDGDSAELEKDQKQAIDPTKSTGTYQYTNECEIVYQHKLLKFKRNSNDALENTEVVIQRDAQKSSTWVIIRLAATKNPILTSLLVKGKSEIKKMGNKDENVILSVLTVVDKKAEKDILKMQFEKAEDGISFREAVQKIIN